MKIDYANFNTYYSLSSAAKAYERNILTTNDYKNALFDITSVVLCSRPESFTEMLWEETQLHYKEVVDTTCLPFLAVVQISHIEDYISAYPR